MADGPGASGQRRPYDDGGTQSAREWLDLKAHEPGAVLVSPNLHGGYYEDGCQQWQQHRRWHQAATPRMVRVRGPEKSASGSAPSAQTR